MRKINLNEVKDLNFFLVVTSLIFSLLLFGTACCAGGTAPCSETEPSEPCSEMRVSPVDINSRLFKYAPVLYMHWDEDYFPKEIASTLCQSDLKTGNILEEPIEGPLTVDNLMANNSSNAELNLWGKEPCRFRLYPDVVYAREYESPDYIALQYLYFFPYDTHEVWDDHEADWETITILINKNSLVEGDDTPEILTAAQHWSGGKYLWETQIETVAHTHPKVFIAKGVHSSWNVTGNHQAGSSWGWLNEPLCTLVNDETSDNGTALYPAGMVYGNDELGAATKASPYTLYKITGSDGWIYWQGRWGPDSFWIILPGVGSPGLTEKWIDPVSWANSPEESATYAVTCSPVNLHVYDFEGNHVGLSKSGLIETEIPGTYLYYPSKDQEEYTVILTEEKLIYKIEATDAGKFDFALVQYFKSKDIKIQLEYLEVDITEKTNATVDLSKSIIMYVDLYGDGSKIIEKKPDTYSINPPVTLYWSEYPNAIRYEVAISEDPTFKIIDWSFIVDNLYYEIDEALMDSTTYYWRVRGVTGEPYLRGTTWTTQTSPWITGKFTTDSTGFARIPLLEFGKIPIK